jgi:AraC-like DNA-binding protein
MSNTNLHEWSKKVEAKVHLELFNPSLSVSWLARVFSLSERQLSRRYKQCRGYTLGQHIQESKLRSAFGAFSVPHPPAIKDVATELGFSDAKYFSRLFRQRFGQYPSQVTGGAGARAQPRTASHQMTRFGSKHMENR